MNILLWGFYSQGNLGDDLMAVMFAEMIRSLGHRPMIYSPNPRFESMGYESTDKLEGLDADLVVLGGGAFFKPPSQSVPRIERAIAELATFVTQRSVPVIGLSLGSDGLSAIADASPARRAIVQSKYFRGSTVRLRHDLEIGLENAEFIPDIVFASAYFRRAFLPSQEHPSDADGEFLINLSRRTIHNLPLALWLARKARPAFFLAHSGPHRSGGELYLPWFTCHHSDDMIEAIDRLGCATAILSSKLHPGIVALSMGREFVSVSPRPKTLAFIREYESISMVRSESSIGKAVRLRPTTDLSSQEELWRAYETYLRRNVP